MEPQEWIAELKEQLNSHPEAPLDIYNEDVDAGEITYVITDVKWDNASGTIQVEIAEL